MPLLVTAVTAATVHHWRHARRRGSPVSVVIRVLRLIEGTGMHRIDHVARINRAKVTEAADVRGAAPSPGLVAHRPRQESP